MGNLLESIKKFLGIASQNDDLLKKPLWKKLNAMIIIASVGVLLIVLANTFTQSGANSPETEIAGQPLKQGETNTTQNEPSDINKLESTLSQRLEKVLSEIDGVGEVKVNVNLASTTQKDYAVNTNTNNKTTRENDQKGGNRTITEMNENGQMVLVRENQGNREEPVVVKEVKPEVKGVIVVAEGAGDPEVKANLMQAVQVYL
ncbi:MAG: hypothetical protein ACYC21_11430, partial [Eubacteriales bacterium]